MLSRRRSTCEPLINHAAARSGLRGRSTQQSDFQVTRRTAILRPTGIIWGGQTRCSCPMTRSRTAKHRIDGAALGGLLAAYAVVFGLFAVWFYPLLHARHNSN